MLGPLCCLLSSLTWILGSSAYAELSKRCNPATVNFNRALVAFPCYAIVCLARFPAVRASVLGLGAAAVGAGAGPGLAKAIAVKIVWLTLSIVSSYGLGDACFMWGSLSIGFPSAQAIGATFPIWAAAAGVLALGEPMNGKKALGILLTVAGTVAVILRGRDASRPPPPAHFPLLRRYSVGVLLALGASLFWALNTFATGRGGAGLDPAAANVYRMAFALGLCAALARVQGGPRRTVFLEAAEYRRYVPFFLVESFAGSYLYMYGLSHATVAMGATLSSLSPVFAVPVALAMGWERFSMLRLLSIVAVVTGVAVLVS